MNNDDRESLRKATLEQLVARAPAAVTVLGVRRAVMRELDFVPAIEDVAAALKFWESDLCAVFTFDPAGSTTWWTPTAKGTLLVERGFRI